jgi:hypothetical protein
VRVWGLVSSPQEFATWEQVFRCLRFTHMSEKPDPSTGDSEALSVKSRLACRAVVERLRTGQRASLGVWRSA